MIKTLCCLNQHVSSQENVFLSPPYLFLQDYGLSAPWNLSPAQSQAKKWKIKIQESSNYQCSHHQICHENKVSQPYPSSGVESHLWEADLTLCPFCADNLPCRPVTTFAGAAPSLHGSGVGLQANDHAGKFSGYLMTAPAWMCHCCSHKAPQEPCESEGVRNQLNLIRRNGIINTNSARSCLLSDTQLSV